jgi:hypothetical protein
MTAAKLDLAQFEGLDAPKALCRYCDEYLVPTDTLALLAEARRLQDENARLRDALNAIRTDRTKDYLRPRGISTVGNFEARVHRVCDDALAAKGAE